MNFLKAIVIEAGLITTIGSAKFWPGKLCSAGKHFEALIFAETANSPISFLLADFRLTSERCNVIYFQMPRDRWIGSTFVAALRIKEELLSSGAKGAFPPSNNGRYIWCRPERNRGLDPVST